VAEERSVSDVFQDILQNLQEMVRSEIRLAKVEIRGEVKQAVSSGACRPSSQRPARPSSSSGSWKVA
jgi:hypothetical protein